MSIVRYIALLLPLTFLGCATPAPGPTAAPDHFAALENLRVHFLEPGSLPY
jgi:hypothetical protein